MYILILIVFFIIALFASIIVTYLSFLISNKVPAKWLCDYNETPTQEMLSNQRFNYKKYGVITTVALFLCYFGVLLTQTNVLTICLLFAIIWALLLVTISDAKYQIIPDQYTIILAVLCCAFGVIDFFTTQMFNNNIWFILLGAVIGFALPMLLNLVTRLLLSKDGIGFGDVKLLSALGLLFGFPYIFAVILISVFVALFHIIYLKLIKKAEEIYVPFGPYIAIASCVLCIFYTHINNGINAYMSLLNF